MFTIWGRANSINVQKVLWTCAELDLPFERIDAGGAFGGTDTAEYRAMNPPGMVPTLKDGNVVVWESNVIVRYLAATHGPGRLCPAEAPARFGQEAWMDWQAAGLWKDFRPLFIGLVRTAPQDRDVAALARAEEATARAFALLDEALRDRPFLGGAALGVADIPAGVTAHRWLALPLDRRPRLPALEDWYARLTERPGFRDHVMTPLS
ncbi:glutathione S-transferase family protein [Caenispirillum salinarum]|uniref:glutathione S-transferase family protein n=1 Tax=Caenispirillum salinarum TaxID=859058 RepID=UPI003851562E